MKQKLMLLLILCTAFLTACGSTDRSEHATITSSEPWPAHAPDATPYVRLRTEDVIEPPMRTEALDPGENRELLEALESGMEVQVYASREEMIRSMYAVEGRLYAKDWELEMFRGLPQEEPYSFVIHTDAMLRGEDTVKDHMQLAKYFTELGCMAKVKEMRAVYEGKEELGWITVVTTTPEHLWELSTQLNDWLHVEQLYPSVDLRFDTVIWPEESSQA